MTTLDYLMDEMVELRQSVRDAGAHYGEGSREYLSAQESLLAVLMERRKAVYGVGAE